jgi:hypothetical protein
LFHGAFAQGLPVGIMRRQASLSKLMLSNGDQHYVSHKEWAETHPGKCNERDLLPWQIETDTLCGRLRLLERRFNESNRPEHEPTKV